MTGKKKSTTVFEAMWDGFKEEHLKCEGDDCKVYSCIMVKNDWVAEDCGMYLCNICMLKRMNDIKDGSEMVKKDNERLKKSNEELRKELQDFKKVEEKKVDELAGNMKMFVKKKDEMKDWTIARRLNNGKVLDKVDSVFSKMDGLQNEVIKQVKVAKVDDMRSRRAIIFGLK